MLFAGVDAGSRTIKVVIIDDARMRILGSGLCDQGTGQADRAVEIFDKVLFKSRLKKKDIAAIVATGYGRNALEWADTAVTEITCQACGIGHQAAHVRTIIDIGGQDSKLIHLDPNGLVRDFAMNDRCAAGTGRFLEIVAERLEMKLEDMAEIAKKADNPAIINSTCAVFAETEIVGLLASGVSAENIAAGVQNSVAKRIGAMAKARLQGPVIFTGGVALIPGMKNALSRALGRAIEVAKIPQMTGALGAAILASETNSGRTRYM